MRGHEIKRKSLPDSDPPESSFDQESSLLKSSPSETIEQLPSYGEKVVRSNSTYGAKLPPKTLRSWPKKKTLLVFISSFVGVILMGALMITFWATLRELGSPVPESASSDTQASCNLYVGSSHTADNNIYDKSICDSQNISTIEQYFVIDMRFGGGNLTFTQVKVIDVAWDIVVGQGGRFLQAWALYHVGADALVWMMERAALPYHLVAAVMFSPVSLWSTWAFLRVLLQKRGWKVWIIIFGMMLATFHVLAFPTIWSVATGYLSPSTVKYQMPDGTLASSTSDTLTSCFQIEDSLRIGLSDGVIIDGGQIVSADYPSCPDKRPPGGNATEWDIFAGIWRYAIQISVLRTTSLGTDVRSTPSTGYYDNFTLPQGYNKSYTPVNSTVRFDWGTVGRSDKSVAPWAFNSSVDYSGGRQLPYNSSLEYLGTVHSLSAPILNLSSSCTKFIRPNDPTYGGLGQCICYNGKPITYDWLSDDNATCVAMSGYVWGFSSSIVSFALTLQAFWCLSVWALWIASNRNSKLVRHRRRLGGSFRTVVDLAEAMKESMGGEIGVYKEDELVDELEAYGDVGYVVRREERSELECISLVGLKRRWGIGEKVDVQEGVLYG